MNVVRTWEKNIVTKNVNETLKNSQKLSGLKWCIFWETFRYNPWSNFLIYIKDYVSKFTGNIQFENINGFAKIYSNWKKYVLFLLPKSVSKIHGQPPDTVDHVIPVLAFGKSFPHFNEQRGEI